MYENKPLDNLINDLLDLWLCAYFQSSWKNSYEGKAHLLPVCVCMYTYISYMHSCAWFWKLVLRIIGSEISLQCLWSFKWDQGNFFSKLFNFINSFFKFSLGRALNSILIIYLLYLLRRYPERLFNVTSSNHQYSNIICSVFFQNCRNFDLL